MKRSAWFLLGALVMGALGIAAPRFNSAVARESISIRVGDTLAWHYSVTTDAILGVGPGVVVGKNCGTSKTFARPWLRRPATHDSIAKSGDSVTVTVTASASGACTIETPVPPTPVPTPAPAPSPGHPNEPAGLNVLGNLTFDSLPSGPYYAINASNPTLVTDSTSPEGSRLVGRMLFPSGFGSCGCAPGSVYQRAYWTQKPTTVYASVWVKLSSNWVANAVGSNKVLFVTRTASGGGSNEGAFEMLGMGGIDGTNQAVWPAPVIEGIVVTPGAVGSGSSGSPTVALRPNLVPYDTTLQYRRGTWTHIEFVLVMNSPGNSDGGIKWWVNGKPYGDYTGHVQWSDQSTQDSFAEVVWIPVYGGASNIIPADQFMYLKNLYVSGK